LWENVVSESSPGVELFLEVKYGDSKHGGPDTCEDKKEEKDAASGCSQHN